MRSMRTYKSRCELWLNALGVELRVTMLSKSGIIMYSMLNLTFAQSVVRSFRHITLKEHLVTLFPKPNEQTPFRC